MRTQVTCPNCQMPYPAEIHQVIDAQQNPELKQQLLSGQLNVAVCPSCGMGGPMGTAMLYHDADHELFMVYVPTELNLPHMEQQQLIGQLTQQAMRNIPQEKRKAYLFQPQTILTMQTFMEKVLETEGITKEMIDRQRKQAELLQTLAGADMDVVDYLLKERGREIDEVFFAMLQQFIDSAAQSSETETLIRLTNLRAKLMTDTAIGREMEKQQIAIHALNREAKKAGGLNTAMFVKHILANIDEPKVVDGLVMAAQGGLSYEFFQLLSAELEKEEMAGNKAKVQQIEATRERLLGIYEGMQNESRRMLDAANNVLQVLLQAEDVATAVQQNVDKIDDAFMYLLSSQIAEADQQGQTDRIQALNRVYNTILKQMESQYPPEVMLINSLLEAPSEAEQNQILDENKAMLTPNLLQMIDGLIPQLEEAGQKEVAEKLQQVKGKIALRVA